MTTRRVLAAAGALALVIGTVTLPADPWEHMVSPIVACVTIGMLLATWPRSRVAIPAAVLTVAGVSVAVTGYFLVTGPDMGTGVITSLWMMLDPAATTVLVYLPMRWAAPRHALWLGGAVTVALALSIHRYPPETPWWEMLAASALWAIPALAAAGAAWYLRAIADRRDRDVFDARQRQRLALAADLHDFVAHDVSEIVAQAQAGRLVLAGDDPRVAELLDRIETAGQRALRAMDRTVHALHDTDRDTVGGLGDLDSLTARFETPTTLRMCEVDDVPREVGAMAYRVVVEALTNVRRHASDATSVTVDVTREPRWLRVTIVNDGVPGDGTSRASGHGIEGLSRRVAAAGGELEAGPHAPRAWRLTARLRLPEEEEST